MKATPVEGQKFAKHLYYSRGAECYCPLGFILEKSSISDICLSSNYTRFSLLSSDVQMEIHKAGLTSSEAMAIQDYNDKYLGSLTERWKAVYAWLINKEMDSNELSKNL